MDNNILKAENILKVYPNGIVANHNVNLSLKSGEIHALVGENGAGKSTLMKILFGIEQPEEGKIFIDGSEVSFNSSKDAINAGVGMVHQHFMLVESLTIAENIFLGFEPTKFQFTDYEKMITTAQELADRYKFNLNVKDTIREVSVGVKQKVEILKALLRGAKILILDEPTAVLTPQETTELFEELNVLKEEGHTIVFITHKLDEVMEICDRVTIMKRGETIKTENIKDTTPQKMSNTMVGRDVKLEVDKKDIPEQGIVAELENISYINSFGEVVLDSINIKLKGGRILGIAGIEGNGQAQISQILTGLLEPTSGKYKIKDKEVTNFNPNTIRKKGITYIPEDRMKNGCAKNESVMVNMLIDKIDSFTGKSNIFIDTKRTETYSKQLVKDFGVVTQSINNEVGMLSGGNIQKVIASREVHENCRLLVAEQPTRGIDTGSAEVIRDKILELRDRGEAIVLVSADLNEILELSDTVLVMYEGKINAYFEDSKDLSEEELGYYMLGLKKQGDEIKIEK